MTTGLRRLAILLVLSLPHHDRLQADDAQAPVARDVVWRLPPIAEPAASVAGPAPLQLPAATSVRPLQVDEHRIDPHVSPATWEPLAQPDSAMNVESIPPSEDATLDPALQLGDVVDSIYATFPLLQVAFRERQIAAGRALAAYGGFDTNLDMSAIEEPLGFYQNYRHGIGAQQGLWSGADVFGGYRIGRGLFKPWFEERDTDNSGEFKAGITVPLLRDRAIDRRRAEVLKNQIARRAVEPAIQSQILRFIRDGSAAYWDWVAAGQNYEVARALLEIAMERDEGIRRRVATGDLAEIEVVDNERLIVSRRASLIQADRKLQQAAIRLSLWLRTPDGIPQVPVPDLLPISFPDPKLPAADLLESAANVAIASRPELVELTLAARAVGVELAAAENQLLPGLSAGVVASKDIGPLASSAGDKRPFELEAALLADVPLQRRAARGKIQAAQGKLAQLNAQRRYAADQITVEVRTAIAALTTAMEQVVQARQAVELAGRMEEAERQKFDQGISDLLLVNLREQQSADAAFVEIEALAGFLKAEVDFRAAIAAPLAP